jgi:hypothetical protein
MVEVIVYAGGSSIQQTNRSLGDLGRPTEIVFG